MKIAMYTILTGAALIAACSIGHASDAGLLSRWSFTPEALEGQVIRDDVGDIHAVIRGDAHLKSMGEASFLLIDGEDTLISMPYDEDSPALPRHAMTVEAWIAMEETVEWAGVVNAGLKRGDYEKGWILGASQSNFQFSISTEATDDGDGAFSDARSYRSLEWGAWHHVVGVYDGQRQALYVNGALEAESNEPGGAILYPNQAEYLIGALTHGDRGLYWKGWIHEASVYDRALSEEEIAARYAKTRDALPRIDCVKVGPYLTRDDFDAVTIQWVTEAPSPSEIYFGDRLTLDERYGDTELKTEHRVTVQREDIREDKIFYYRIAFTGDDGQTRYTRAHEFDATFDFASPAHPVVDSPYPEDDQSERIAAIAERMASAASSRKGYCLVLGGANERLAFEIAKRSDYDIVIIDEDAETVRRLRRTFDSVGLYGVRVTVQRASLLDLPFTSYFANLIVASAVDSDGALPPAEEMFRVLRPCGGAVFLGEMASADSSLTQERLDAWLNDSAIPNDEIDSLAVNEMEGAWLAFTRKELPGSGEWTHMYADPGNTSCSADSLPQDPLRVMWFGRPGPRNMVDRGTRSPAPLSAKGRLIVQGDRCLFGVDAYNGTMMWSTFIPNLRRANIPRDSSNMVLDGDHLFVAIRDACWKIDAQTGELKEVFYIPNLHDDIEYDWGYLAHHEGLLLGSVVRRGGIYVGADGEWYDKANQESHKVVSDALFAMNPHTGELVWIREGAPIINSTIAAGDGQIFLVESRNPEAVERNRGRLDNETLSDRYLLALSASDGEPLWETTHNFSEGRWVFYQSYFDDTLVIVSTTDRYQIYAFDAPSGELLWEHDYEFYRDHHGGAMQKPVIVGEMVYAEPRIFHLRSGEMMDRLMPQRTKCGTITAGANALFYRDYFYGMWDLENDTRTHYVGVRPGCWLGVIPAGGVVLAPESSAGCYCAHAIQTSLAFMPLASLGR